MTSQNKQHRILALKTDGPVTGLFLLDDNKIVAENLWQSDRNLANEIFNKIEEFLASNQLTLQDLTGLIGFLGPGSFTGLRIGLTVLNAFSFSLSIPIVGSNGENWLKEGRELLGLGKNQIVLIPEYGSEANITAPKK